MVVAAFPIMVRSGRPSFHRCLTSNRCACLPVGRKAPLGEGGRRCAGAACPAGGCSLPALVSRSVGEGWLAGLDMAWCPLLGILHGSHHHMVAALGPCRASGVRPTGAGAGLRRRPITGARGRGAGRRPLPRPPPLLPLTTRGGGGCTNRGRRSLSVGVLGNGPVAAVLGRGNLAPRKSAPAHTESHPLSSRPNKQTTTAVPQDFPHQARAGQEAKAEPAAAAVDPVPHGQHHPVSRDFLFFVRRPALFPRLPRPTPPLPALRPRLSHPLSPSPPSPLLPGTTPSAATGAAPSWACEHAASR